MQFASLHIQISERTMLDVDYQKSTSLFSVFCFPFIPSTPPSHCINNISCLTNKILTTNKEEQKRNRRKEAMRKLKSNSDPNPRLQHFSHPHELELCTQKLQNNPTPTPCSGCKLPPISQMYTCKPCNFTLHLSCTQLPQLINHPSHPDHPLALLPRSKYPGGLFNCDACNNRGDGFSYHCSDCEYDLHVICASKPLKIIHQLHQCQLELTFKNPYADAKGFSCDVCQKIGVKQWLYRCSTCDFDVHLDCSNSAPISAVQGSSILQHHHSFPEATSSHNQFQQPPNKFVHSASSGATCNQLSQTPILAGQAMPNQNAKASMGTAQARSNTLFHSANTGSTPQHLSLQPHLIQGLVRPDQYMQPPRTSNDLMNAAVQGLVEVAAQQVGQTIMQGFIGGGNNSDGNEGSPILRSIFGDSMQN